jgi:CheY-like chemotaxis protein
MAPTILVVEDEALIAMHIKSILVEIGYAAI